MCGIVAMYTPGGSLGEDALKRATQRLAHRGPDGQRLWVSPDHRVGLGHARLSIIDLATGDQPIASEDERLLIVVNGEFYDFERIQSQLMARGHRLRTRSDSEIALHLYEDFGTGCLSQLRGEFAFVLWDDRNKLLFAARDRFGIKPLYYSWAGGTLYLASEVKALLAAGVPARWDRSAFFGALHHYAPPQHRSLFEGVCQVPPGAFLVASGDESRLEHYWDFDYSLDEDIRAGDSDAEYTQRFREALDGSVRLRLRADVPVGCYLSGGLDSCAVLGLAAHHRADPIRAFTLTFDQPDYDEEVLAREMADHANADFYPVPITQSDLADNFVDAILYAETLAMNAHGVAKYLLSRAVRNAGYKVVLTGEGADEILAGYPHFRRDMLLYHSKNQDQTLVSEMLDQLEASNQVSHGILLPDGETASLESVRAALGFVPTWLEANATIAQKLIDLFSADFLAEIAGRVAYSDFLASLDIPGQLAGRAPLNQSLYSWSKVVLPNYVLTYLGDRMEMSHSIEGRLAFLDHHVVELCRGMPISQKIRGPIEKYVLREAAQPVLTASVYRRHKHPFLTPPAALALDGRLFALAQDTLRGPALAAMPFFDQSKVAALLDRLPGLDEKARTAYDPALMILLSACVLQDGYGL